jgi:hypothetical protein
MGTSMNIPLNGNEVNLITFYATDVTFRFHRK